MEPNVAVAMRHEGGGAAVEVDVAEVTVVTEEPEICIVTGVE